MKLKMSKGFTLIELMIVVAIIGILAAVAIPKFADLVTKSKEASVKGGLGSVRSAISIYYGDLEGTYPGNNSLVVALTTAEKYMPSNTGLGDFTLPKNSNPGTGHAGSKVVLDTQVRYTATGAAETGAGTTNIAYDSSTSNLWVNCVHQDTRSVIWSAY